VQECVDPKLEGEYPPVAVAKVTLFCISPSPSLYAQSCDRWIFYSEVGCNNECHSMQVAAIAALCVQNEADFRPNMSIVVKALQPLLWAPASAEET
jgi:hypothetical protein